MITKTSINRMLRGIGINKKGLGACCLGQYGHLGGKNAVKLARYGGFAARAVDKNANWYGVDVACVRNGLEKA